MGRAGGVSRTVSNTETAADRAYNCTGSAAVFSFLFFHFFTDRQNEIPAVQNDRIFDGGDQRQVFGHLSGFDHMDRSGLQFVCETAERLVAVQLSSFSQSAGPREDGGYGVGGCLLSFQMAVIVALYGTVRRLILIISVRGNQHGGHHCQRTEGGGYHVAH